MGSHIQQPLMLDEDIPPPRAWTKELATPERWKLPIDKESLAEIEAFVTHWRRNPLDFRLLEPGDYDFDHCREMMRRVRTILDDDIGFVVLDVLPLSYSKQEMTVVYWLLSTMLARPVAQSYDGKILYDVRDTGVQPDIRVRADLTNAELFYHTDYGFNFPPRYLGLLVLRVAREGGGSSVASMLHAHNRLRREQPELLQRLYEPFHWNRQGEHPEGDPITHFYPMFSYDGKKLRARFNTNLPFKGYVLLGSKIDDLGARALKIMGDFMSEPDANVNFLLEPGQIQFANNESVAHRRYNYVDYEDMEDRRHLVRIFLRDEGRRTYMG